MQIALKVDVDTLRGTLEGVPALLRLLDAPRCPRDLPVQPRSRPHRPGDQAHLPARASSPRCAAPRWRAITGSGPCCTAPCCRARTSAGARATSCARPRPQDTRSGSTATTTSSGRTRSRTATPPGPAARWSARPRPSSGCSGVPRTRTAPPAGRSTRMHSRSRRSSATAGPATPAAPRPSCRSWRAWAHAALNCRRRCRPSTSCSGSRTSPRQTCTSGSWRPAVGNCPPGTSITLHAELEGMQLLPVMDRLLSGWRAAGRGIVAMDDVAGRLQSGSLPVHEVVWGEVAGRSGQLAQQGPQLAAAH